MKCWICGSDAHTREHRTKASDVRALFGSVSQHAPLYLHIGDRKNIKIQSVNSDKLKFETRLCGECNNARTQPHDKAWQRLSEYLRNRRPSIKPGMLVDLSAAFPGTVGKSMLAIHLYFLKVFGCLAGDSAAPMPLKDFAKAIMGTTPHPWVHIAFAAQREPPLRKATAISPMHVVQMEQAGAAPKPVFASWVYHLNGLNAVVMYADPSAPAPSGLRSYWHPTTVTKHLRIAKLEALVDR